MKRPLLIFLLLLTGVYCLSGQAIVVQGTIEHPGDGQIYLASYYGDRFRIIDSMETSSGAFYFVLSGEEQPGIYRIIFSDVYQGIMSENRFIEFVFNRKDIEVFIASGRDGPVPYFENSIENEVYLEFMSFELAYEEQLMEVYDKLYFAESDHPDHLLAVGRYDELQQGRTRFMDSLSAIHPGLYAIRIMNAFRAPVIPGSMPHRERIDTLKSCFFNHAPIDDPLLLYAPVYTFKLIDYLSLFRVDSMTMDQQEDQFIDAVDRIMVNVTQDPVLRSFVVESLLEGFELLGMEKVQVHLADHYLDESCEADIVELVLSRMEGYKTMNEGQKAPDFVIRDIQGKNHQLSHLTNPFVLVIFWASTCEHCREMIPDLHEWYLHENNLDMEMVAISIDTSVAFFEAFVSDLDLQWITVCDPQGWNGRVPGDYFVYATPSLFLLDRDRTILARPYSYRQFLRAVKKLVP